MSKRLILHRWHQTDDITLGTLYCDGLRLACLERGWRPNAPGGMPSQSCIPAGRYQLVPHEREDGDDVLALVNPGLGVYYLDRDRPNKVGRFLILIHVANWVHEVEGCLAPGMRHEGESVRESTKAMGHIMYWGPKEIEIIGGVT